MATAQTPLDAAEIAARLRRAGAMIRFRGGSRHRARAYIAGAEVVEAFAGDIAPLAANGHLTDLPRIGPSLAASITELARDGSSPTLDRIMGGLPPGLLDLMDVPGFTPRRIQRLHDELGVESTDAVRAALASGAARVIKGFGPATAAKLLAGLAAGARPGEGVVWAAALKRAESLAASLRAASSGAVVVVAGDVRRSVETIKTLTLVAHADRPEALLSAFAHQPGVLAVTDRAHDRAAARLTDGLEATLTIVPPPRFGAALLLATGAAIHVAQVEERALARGVALEELEAETESEVYAALNLPFVPPELREGRGELEAAEAGDTFADLLTLADLRGAVHCHTVYSDGRDSIADMAAGAAALGLTYLTITDHSPAAGYAGGLSTERLAEQQRDLAGLRARLPVDVLAGAECDILRDGSLDHGDDVRRRLDIIIASIHERFKMDRSAMTERLRRALSTPRFKIWGHPLGRLLLRRPPIDCDLDVVLDAAAAAPTAIEINGSPWRLDLPPAFIPAARRRGLKFVVSADAHSVRELAFLRYGVAMARRGGLRRSDVLNTLPTDEFRRAVL